MTLEIVRGTEPLPLVPANSRCGGEKNFRSRGYERTSIRVRAGNESVIPLFRLASCRRLASGDDDLGGRDTAADETETRPESVRCSLAGDIKPGYRCL